MPDPAREIENLLYTYAERIDAGDLEGVADLFAHGRIVASPDASNSASNATSKAASKAQAVEGREAVLAMYRGSTRLYEDGTPRTRHVTTNAIIDVEDGADHAAARSCFTVLQRVDALPLQPIISGRYHDTFQRIDGRWWFDTRTMLIDLIGNLGHHLLFELR